MDVSPVALFCSKFNGRTFRVSSQKIQSSLSQRSFTLTALQYFHIHWKTEKKLSLFCSLQIFTGLHPRLRAEGTVDFHFLPFLAYFCALHNLVGGWCFILHAIMLPFSELYWMPMTAANSYGPQSYLSTNFRKDTCYCCELRTFLFNLLTVVSW